MYELTVLEIIRESLSQITNSHWFQDERGYQGELLSEIKKRISDQSWAASAVVQQEYQKRLEEHGLKIRPDLIIHVPFDSKIHKSRREGNFAVIELKINASKAKALEDYQHLSDMCDALDYPLAIFINIGGEKTFFKEYNGTNREKIIAFAVQLIDGEVKLKEKTASYPNPSPVEIGSQISYTGQLQETY
jgi:hypothetical protein